MASEFHRIGLADVEIDKQGNVLGLRPGEIQDTFAIAAHLDISFAEGVNAKVRKEATRWFGPGLADDSLGLADLLTIVETMNEAAISSLESPVRARLKAFISIDGSNPAHLVTGGTGVKRYRVEVSGPGGHSYGNFGRPSAIHAAGRIIDRISDLDVPAQPKTTFNVGRISGGTAVNAIAENCSFEVDLRSVDPGQLDRIEAKPIKSSVWVSKMKTSPGSFRCGSEVRNETGR